MFICLIIFFLFDFLIVSLSSFLLYLQRFFYRLPHHSINQMGMTMTRYIHRGNRNILSSPGW